MKNEEGKKGRKKKKRKKEDSRVDRWETIVWLFVFSGGFPDNSKTRVEIGKASRRQGGAARGECQEGLRIYI